MRPNGMPKPLRVLRYLCVVRCALPVLTTLDCATRSYRPTIRELPHQWMQVRLFERLDGASSGSRSPLGTHFRVLQVKTGGFLVGAREGQEFCFAV
jgi:hypothetical protein